ncbi:MAG TPA: FMN-binding protein [Intrasporangium sp.]|uniref:FMN-binding protein n=1 Tax=Intrasporangium sp. TaxID=1925024 RepID=UPI002D765208|nr:FMN-binding protein [Intrasporangium sp.]HET7399314.1 FMN-binding protein [Intrasporangium sp.]
MRRIVTWAMSTLTVLVLLFSYSTSRSSQPVAATAETRRVTTTTTQHSAATSGSSGSSPTSAAAAARTVTGDEAMTRYGVVQVQITVQDGKITKSEAVQAPSENRHDQMINSQAVPVYNDEVVAAQSAGIDMVSGATVTYDGYVQSLQSAIDKANL